MRNTAYLLDIQVLSPEDIEANLHLQDWWAEETVDGDIPGVSFTVDKTEVPVIPYGVTDPAPAFEVVPDDPAFLDISLVDKDYKSVDQSNGFVLWYKLPKDGSLTKAPSDNRIRINVTNMGLRMFFTTVKNGNPGGFFRVTCGRSTRYIPIITPKYVRTDEMFNKSMTSNCYIAEKEGGYRFAGTVMGNGADGLPPAVQASMLPYNANGYLMGATPSPVIAPKSAKLLWQDVDGLITQVGFDTNTTSRGDVVFYVSGTKGPGNAVISVYDKADPNDPAAKVLWSWHIWCAPRPVDIPVKPEAGAELVAGEKYIFMDRNVGAEDSKEVGMHYQYGRKDPYIDYETIGHEYIYDLLGRDVTALLKTVSDPPEQYEKIRFPLTYYAGIHSMDGPSTGKSSGLWGTDRTAYKNVISDDVKTIYDPCPPGYKVPDMRPYKVVRDKFFLTGKYDFKVSNSFVSFVSFQTSPRTLYFPNGGRYYVGERGGSILYAWTTGVVTPNKSHIVFTCTYNDSKKEFDVYNMNAGIADESFTQVRCISE